MDWVVDIVDDCGRFGLIEITLWVLVNEVKNGERCLSPDGETGESFIKVKSSVLLGEAYAFLCHPFQ